LITSMPNLPTIRVSVYINIVPKKCHRYKHIIKYIFRIVIVVGLVDSVDKKQIPIDVG
jgi:hypothetical protein